MTIRELTLSLLSAALWAVMPVVIEPRASAATIDFDFSASLTTGPLAGTTFNGIGAYDPGSDPESTPHVPLTFLDFTIDGVDVASGGYVVRNAEVDLANGIFFSFEASYTATAPRPIEQVEFGVSLPPGIVTYIVAAGFAHGGGTYEATTTPEPSSLLFCGGAMLVSLLLGCLRTFKGAHPSRERTKLEYFKAFTSKRCYSDRHAKESAS